MTNYLTDTEDVEQHKITDTDGEPWAILSYIQPKTPRYRYDEWVVDFHNGERLTGEVANEVARRLMDAGLIDTTIAQEFDRQRDAMLDDIGYDPDSMTYNITVRGMRVWFKSCDNVGDDVVLYQDDDQKTRAGVIEDAPFDARDLRWEMDLERGR